MGLGTFTALAIWTTGAVYVLRLMYRRRHGSSAPGGPAEDGGPQGSAPEVGAEGAAALIGRSRSDEGEGGGGGGLNLPRCCGEGARFENVPLTSLLNENAEDFE